MRAARVKPTLPPKVGYFCGHCAQGHHALCSGGAASGTAAPNAGTGCACAGAGHDPGDGLAAWMRLARRPDLVGDTVEALAAEYRGSGTRGR